MSLLRKLFICLIYFGFSFQETQGQRTEVSYLLSKVNKDTLMHQINRLCGYDTVAISGVKQTIKSRYENTKGNENAGLWLLEQLRTYNLTPNDHSFSSLGKNIYAIKRGSVYPDKAFMICAHYDAIAAQTEEAKGADDNASGVAAVLEAARILKDTSLAFTIVFAFFDEEEQNLVGSKAFTPYWFDKDIDLQGVINLDMIGHDKNNDGKMEIHSRPFGFSQGLANHIIQSNEKYTIGLIPEIRDPGTRASDHASFWDINVSAVMLIEHRLDFNPYYHTRFDLPEYLNDSFLYKNTKLALASLLDMASNKNFVLNVTYDNAKIGEFNVFPNPSFGSFEVESSFDLNKIEILTYYGQKVFEQSFFEANTNNLKVNINLNPGIYFLSLSGKNNELLTKKILVR
jgi:hypothetical protein